MPLGTGALTTNAGGPATLKADGTVDLTDTATLSGGTSNATGTITRSSATPAALGRSAAT